MWTNSHDLVSRRTNLCNTFWRYPLLKNIRSSIVAFVLHIFSSIYNFGNILFTVYHLHFTPLWFSELFIIVRTPPYQHSMWLQGFPPIIRGIDPLAIPPLRHISQAPSTASFLGDSFSVPLLVGTPPSNTTPYQSPHKIQYHLRTSPITMLAIHGWT